MTIECHGGRLINVVNATFGRLDSTTCLASDEEFNKDTNCRAANSLSATRELF